MDPDVCKSFVSTLESQGIKFLVNTEIVDSENFGEKGIFLNMRSMKDKYVWAEKADICLVSVGRAPKTKNLGLEKIGIETNNRGMILTNDFW